MLDKALSSGAAAEVFAHMVHYLGGPSDLLSAPNKHLLAANVIKPVFAKSKGYISSIDTRELGMSIVELGGGRKSANDTIDYSVGFTEMIQLGDNTEQPLTTIHARTESDWQQAAAKVQTAVKVTDRAPDISPVIYEVIHAQ